MKQEKKYNNITLDTIHETAGDILETFSDVRIFLLFGDLGAGKTTLVQEFCKHLGVTDYVSSPTYALINEYEDRQGAQVFHMDLYRLKDEEELYDLGAEEYLHRENYVFIEWPEKIMNLLPETYVKISIFVKDNTRNIHCSW